MSESTQEEAGEKLDPGSIDRLDPEAYLEGGWRLIRCLPGKVVTLEQERREQVRGLFRTAMALVIPLLIAVILVLGTRSTPGEMWLVTYPLAALFLAVVVLGLFSLRRRLRRVTEGVRLELDSRTDRVAGMPEASLELARTLEDFNARSVRAPISAVEAVRVTLHRGSTDPTRKRRTLATLTLEVRVAGRVMTLEGPHAWADDEVWQEARDAMLPLACELARIARKPMVIDYRWKAKQFQVPLESVDAVPLPPTYEPR